MTLTGYGDSAAGTAAGITYRSLSYKVECENVWDLKKCVKIIDSYNEFAAADVCAALNKHLSFAKFYSEGNPNNGNELLRYEIAREGSPAIYVRFSHYNMAGGDTVKILTDREGNLIYTEEYHVDDFVKELKGRCQQFANDTAADECDIQQDYNENGLRIITYRFWWD